MPKCKFAEIYLHHFFTAYSPSAVGTFLSIESKRYNGNLETSLKHDICYLSLLMTSPILSSRMVNLYVCMYDGWNITFGSCTATFSDLLCFPFLINPLLILHLDWNVGRYLWGRHSSHLVPWKTGPGDEILNKLWLHNHIGYVWVVKPNGNMYRFNLQSFCATLPYTLTFCSLLGDHERVYTKINMCLPMFR
jgi:hypothetical protein